MHNATAIIAEEKVKAEAGKGSGGGSRGDGRKEDNMIIGVVGAAYSSVTAPLARSTLTLGLPLVSYAATRNGEATLLTNGFSQATIAELSHYEMFARTVWSDDIQVEAIRDIIKRFGLTSVKTIGTEDLKNHRTISKQLKENFKDNNTVCEYRE